MGVVVGGGFGVPGSLTTAQEFLLCTCSLDLQPSHRSPLEEVLFLLLLYGGRNHAPFLWYLGCLRSQT